MLKNLSFRGKKSIESSGAYRFYCNDSQDCRLAEKTLQEAHIPFVKIPSIQNDPILITAQQICRSLEEINRFTAASLAIKKEYSIDWK